MKTISITGSSGFVGKAIETFFKLYGYKIIPIKRETLDKKEDLKNIISSSNIIINLAGENIINRWTPKYKKLLYSSRIDTTSKIIEAINSVDNKPELLISTSAIGIYDNQNICDENGQYSNNFLSKLCQAWEKEAKKAKIDVSIFRLGIVLGKNGGALEKMILPFKLGLGGSIGNGKQPFSYIHMDDLLNIYKFVIENHIVNTLNLTAPAFTTNLGLTKALGKVLKRPTFFTVPQFILKLIFSEGAQVLTSGQRVVPKKLLDLGFKFKYKNIQDTISSLV